MHQLQASSHLLHINLTVHIELLIWFNVTLTHLLLFIISHVAGAYNISSCLTIGSEFDASLPNLKERAQSEGHWKPEDGDFHFANVFGATFTGLSLADIQLPSNRLKSGKELLTNAMSKGKDRRI